MNSFYHDLPGGLFRQMVGKVSVTLRGQPSLWVVGPVVEEEPVYHIRLLGSEGRQYLGNATGL